VAISKQVKTPSHKKVGNYNGAESLFIFSLFIFNYLLTPERIEIDTLKKRVKKH
jgi:hypothetical protein